VSVLNVLQNAKVVLEKGTRNALRVILDTITPGVGHALCSTTLL
jgi:hypothetical protein